MTSDDFRQALPTEYVLTAWDVAKAGGQEAIRLLRNEDEHREERNARWLSPDCRDGKCQPCTGPAWDEDEDCLTVCACGCHEDGA